MNQLLARPYFTWLTDARQPPNGNEADMNLTRNCSAADVMLCWPSSRAADCTCVGGDVD